MKTMCKCLVFMKVSRRTSSCNSANKKQGASRRCSGHSVKNRKLQISMLEAARQICYYAVQLLSKLLCVCSELSRLSRSLFLARGFYVSKLFSSYASKLFCLMLSCFKPSFGRLCFIVSDATTFREQCRECHKAISHRIQGRESCKFLFDELRGPAYGCLCVLRSAFLVKRRNRTQYKTFVNKNCTPGIS